MRILYAANNQASSYFQLQRFLETIKNSNHQIKIAAYKASSGNLNIDYTLDCLLNFTNPEGPINFNNNYNYYFNEIKRFNPNLIISDLEIYTSLLAIENKIKNWIVSPDLLYYAIPNKLKQQINIHNKYSYLIDKDFRKQQYISFIIKNTDRKLVNSHLCDLLIKFELKKDFEWIRPDFYLGKDVKHDYKYLGVLSEYNQEVINYTKNDKSINLIHQINYDKNSYIDLIENTQQLINDGTEMFLADAFYNQKYSLIFPNYNEFGNIFNSYINHYYQLGNLNTEEYKQKEINIQINEQVKFLCQEIK